MYVKRDIEAKIKDYLFKGKILIIYGPRQVGKTTLVKKIMADHGQMRSRYINCDQADERGLLLNAQTSTQLKDVIGDAQLVIIDKAQRVTNIGLKLKLLVDNYPKQQIIATGSSSFELANKIVEPLTGRTREFWLYPFSLSEMQTVIPSPLEINRRLESWLLYGTYPEIVAAASLDEKKTAIQSISNNYLYKDLLEFGKIKNSEILHKLLEALALQLGNEVSYTELGSLLQINKETVASYITLLEQSFIIFHLRPFSRNLRKELSKLRKIYFWDTGIRNTLINNFNPISLRTDIGALWENFIISEKKKQQNFIGNLKSYYFWRTWDQQEVDLVEDAGGQLHGFEIKWQKTKKRPPKAWRETYLHASWQTITRDNFLKVLK